MNRRPQAMPSHLRALLDQQHGVLFLPRMHDAIARTRLPQRSKIHSALGLKPDELELSGRVALYNRYVENDRLNGQIISKHLSKRGAIVGLPASWRRVIEESGVRLHRRRSKLLWFTRVVWIVLEGTLFAITLSIECLAPKAIRRRHPNPDGKSVHIHGVAAGNFPIGLPTEPATDFVSWLGQNTELFHDVTVITSRYTPKDHVLQSSIPILRKRRLGHLPNSLRTRVQLIGRIARLMAIGFISTVRRDWATLALLPHIPTALLFTETYLHHNEAHVFTSSNADSRPLWSFVAEKYVPIVLCHYSINDEPPTQSDIDAPAWGSLRRWPHQLVWDERQKVFLSSLTESETTFDIVGPISFVATREVMVKPSAPYVAAFALDPMSSDLKAWRTQAGSDIATVEFIDAFFSGILHVCRLYDWHLVIKPKRKLTPGYHAPQHFQLLKALAQMNDVTVVSVEAGTEQVIRNSLMVVSLPFTSTGVHANFLGRPSCFFDPSQKSLPRHPAARGLPLLFSRSELHLFMSSYR